ncbi:MAG: YicC/YloC family endoribonuclease [Gammaproteobacteria bacterium]
MTNSMTAFAREQSQGNWGSATLEMRAVNHRYLDMNIRLPEGFRELELKIRDRIQKSIARGKLDLTLRFTPGPALVSDMTLNEHLSKQLIACADQINGWLTKPNTINPIDILKWPGAIQTAETDFSEIHEQILTSLDNALEKLKAARHGEGEKLKKFMLDSTKKLSEIVEKVEPQIPEILSKQKEKILSRLREINGNYDQDRVEQELVLLAQRMDVTEEITRLKAHIQEVENILTKNGPVGRRLDFLMQELHREANTLGAKSIAVDSTQVSIDLKVLIEQMREQVQNIE